MAEPADSETPPEVPARPQAPAMTTAQVDAARSALIRVSCDDCGTCLYAADTLPEGTDPTTFLADLRDAAGCRDEPRACPPTQVPAVADLAAEPVPETAAPAPTVDTATSRADMLAVLRGLRTPLDGGGPVGGPAVNAARAVELRPAVDLPTPELSEHPQSTTARAARTVTAGVEFTEAGPEPA